ncbi:two-component system, response regulator YesN [Lachnospiraceae bacterium YSD2013]|nr:response regulator [Lachnospiraceae bacterium]SCX12572.1 two-component system, response regulator YesN [Lachnospiraceae bacterium YSD2013]
MKVFLADDEIVIREGIRESFPWEETPYVLVGEAPDGEMALPMIRDTNPDIVITDIKMPFMDGIELCRTLRAQMPWIGIIVLSGYDEFEYARQCIQLGVREYLLKPINAEELKSVLDKVSAQIKAERNTFEHAASLRARMETGGKFVKEKLVGSLFSDEAAEEDARPVLEQLRNMGCPVPAPYYAVIDAAFSPTAEGQEAAAVLAESSNGKVLCSPGRVGTRFLVLGDSAEDAEERAYAFATSLARELERSDCKDIRVGIGDIVGEPEKIYTSFKAARHIRHLLVERTDEQAIILGTREMGDVADDKAPAIINEAKLYMSSHFTNPNLMLQDVAKAVNMSNSRFSTVFSQQNGQTFTEYLMYLRLNKAKELLRTTGTRSSQIAREVGYNDAHYFSYIFKKNTGLTPSDYRAQYQNQPE